MRRPVSNRNDQAKQAEHWASIAVNRHRHYGGKMETVPRCVVRGMDDFSVWYSPGVAAACRAIEADPDLLDELSNRWNTVAVVSDGSRVLGLGKIGAKAGYPVMEGKALPYKYLGGVDSVPIVLADQDPDSIIRTVLNLQPSFGGINLEDISQPKCFRVLDTLRAQAEIPIWHDDQQGTATVTLAGLLNALDIVGKQIEDVRIAFIGAGAPASPPPASYLAAARTPRGAPSATAGESSEQTGKISPGIATSTRRSRRWRRKPTRTAAAAGSPKHSKAPTS